ncbi:MAG: 1-deoxy-D-xylulose-5-phosphate synthase [Alphaproteobacteria bacterium]|jgi:1-deoxy-D-xylulose-5-phosphate synthase
MAKLVHKIPNNKKATKQPCLDRVNFPQDIKGFSTSQLEILAEEIRQEIIFALSKIGGHLGAALGVCELTVALHYVFNAPKDKIIFDVGHQAHPHKILTGRKDKIGTLKQKNGLSGFLKRSESEYDVFGAGHSSTSLSASLGIAVARDLQKEHFEIVAVIGDGALSAGMAFEALNNISISNSKIIIILNDNEMSISKAVGGLNKYLNEIPTQNNIFTQLGFEYTGVLDGHNLPLLIKALENAKNNKQNKPHIIHIKTEKGKGFNANFSGEENYHSVKKFDYNTLKPIATSANKTFTDVFAETLTLIAKNNDKIIAITAAMKSGTGLNNFAKLFPTRFFDTGIAEQHSVTFAGGLAVQGFIPFVCIYSTFLQRAYDQVIHDIALQSLPVKFIIDRAGLVGEDGETHQGAFDLSYLTCLPNFIVMAPSNEFELQKMLEFSLLLKNNPVAIRFPKSEVFNTADTSSKIELGKANIVHSPIKPKIAVIALGIMVSHFLPLAEKYQLLLIDARFAKPFDKNAVELAVKSCSKIIIAEDGSDGGFGAKVLEYIVGENLHHNKTIKTISLPDRFINHQSMKQAYADAGLDTASIEEVIKELL